MRWAKRTQAESEAILPAAFRPFDLEDVHESLPKKTFSQPSGENATLFACDRCPPHFVSKFAAFFL